MDSSTARSSVEANGAATAAEGDLNPPAEPLESPSTDELNPCVVYQSWPDAPGVIARERFKESILNGDGMIAPSPFHSAEWSVIRQRAVHPHRLHEHLSVTDCYIGFPKGLPVRGGTTNQDQWINLAAMPPTIPRLVVSQPGRRTYRRRTLKRDSHGTWRLALSYGRILASVGLVLGLAMGLFLILDWAIGGANPLAFALGAASHALLPLFGYRLYEQLVNPTRRRPEGSVRPWPVVGWVVATLLLVVALYSADRWVLDLPIDWGVRAAFIILSMSCLAAGFSITAVLFTYRHENEVPTIVDWLRTADDRIGALLFGIAAGFGVSVIMVAIFAFYNQVEVDQDAIDVGRITTDIEGSYVVLGDSYSAGEGLTNVIPGLRPKCHRSTLAYPMLLDFTENGGAPLEFRACSGDVSYDVVRTIVGGHEPQIDQAVRDDVGLVTITVGGNDIVFSDIVQSCLIYENCIEEEFDPRQANPSRPTIRYPDPKPLSDWVKEILEGPLEQNLNEVYSALRAAYPKARIVVLGYPYLFPAGDPWTGNLDCVLVLNRVDEAERSALRLFTNSFNNRLFEWSSAHEIEFLSTVAAWHNHEPCGSDGQFTNAVKPAIRLLNPVDGASFHPNEQGHRRLAQLLSCYLNEFPERPDVVPESTPYGSAIPQRSTNDRSLSCTELLARADEPLQEPGD